MASTEALIFFGGRKAGNCVAATFSIEFDNNNLQDVTAPFADDKIFLLAKGKAPVVGQTNPDLLPESFLQFDKQGVGSFFRPRLDSDSDQFATRLSDIVKPERGPRILTVPTVFSGRLYLSVGSPVRLIPKISAANGLMTLADPNPLSTNDNSYPLLYDKVEFTFDLSNVLTLNSTAVDFFAMPLSIFGAGRTVGLSSNRQDVIKAFEQTDVNDKPVDDAWKHVAINLGGAVLRLVAPGQLPPGFPSGYLDPCIQEIWQHYQATPAVTLNVDCNEIGQGLFTGSVVGNKFQFKQDSNEQNVVEFPVPSSTDVFACAGTLAASGNTPAAVIAKNLAAAINLGLLPLPSGTVLNAQFFHANSESFYQENTLLPAAPNPTYNYYSALLHGFKNGDVPEAIYAFPFDDVAGQDSTVATQMGPVGITIHDLTGTALPDLTDNTSYNITVNPPGAATATVSDGVIELVYLDVKYRINVLLGSCFPFMAGLVVEVGAKPESGDTPVTLTLPNLKFHLTLLHPVDEVPTVNVKDLTAVPPLITVTWRGVAHMIQLRDENAVDPPLNGLRIKRDAMDFNSVTLDFNNTAVASAIAARRNRQGNVRRK